MEQGMRQFLEALLAGEKAVADAQREELLRETPRRVVAALAEDLLTGYREDPAKILEPMPAENVKGPVLLREIHFTSICAHHLLPFRGVAHVGFVPEGRRVGLGGIARLVDALSRRLTLQETLTAAIADHVERALRPYAVLVALEAEHLCLAERGARKREHRFRTVERRGAPCAELESMLFGWPVRR
jgi:GTP cyclohydrolase I